MLFDTDRFEPESPKRWHGAHLSSPPDAFQSEADGTVSVELCILPVE